MASISGMGFHVLNEDNDPQYYIFHTFSLLVSKRNGKSLHICAVSSCFRPVERAKAGENFLTFVPICTPVNINAGQYNMGALKHVQT